ncbi:DUF4440 domain-containing protein [Fulvivirga sp. 29W222]|uniref:DUF4440 domain-containing protein n=1 Tax=Fulvivirga marina TaxID=2494733 RepID=A0A937KGG7_9BACT|nr:DUF4440 domain-containing protein [Fulvivirga marina]MBL6449178.1 DUF4440 domain-containing protein [Fulvivirga marina]
MKKCKPNSTWLKTKIRFYNSTATAFSILIITTYLLIMGCSDLESDLTVASGSSTEMNPTSVNFKKNKPMSKKCITTGQEITDRHQAYVAAFVTEDINQLYNDFWTPDFHEFVPNFDKNRDEMLDQMIFFYENGGELYSYDLESLERYVYNNVVYDIGAYDNPGKAINGTPFVINGYYFLRWKKGNDHLWHVDRGVAGPRGNSIPVNHTTDEGAVICFGNHVNDHNKGNDAINQDVISQRFDEYMQALATGDADKAYKFYTQDFRLLGLGLDLDRDELYVHYRQFFETGSVVSSDDRLHDRFIHGNVAFDIGQSDKTVIKDGVQSLEKSNYVIRWEKGQDGVWRIDRIMDLLRL